jgi:hypothetical protein
MLVIQKDDWSYCSCTISDDDIESYAKTTGDRNPIHFGDNRIAHGGLILGKLSAAIWQKFGNGTVGKSISAKIQRTIKPGEEFFIALSPPKPTDGSSQTAQATVEFTIYKSHKGHQKLVLEGVTTVIIPENSVSLPLIAASA